MTDPLITRIEVHEYTYTLENLGTDYNGFNLVYSPGERVEPRGHIIRILSDAGVTGEYAGGGDADYAILKRFKHYLLGRNADARRDWETALFRDPLNKLVQLYLNTLDTVSAVEKLVRFYVHEHNTRLPHSAFQGQTPDEMDFQTGHIAQQLEAARQQALRARAAANRRSSGTACPARHASQLVAFLCQPRPDPLEHLGRLRGRRLGRGEQPLQDEGRGLEARFVPSQLQRATRPVQGLFQRIVCRQRVAKIVVRVR